jgi:hypothetical protein
VSATRPNRIVVLGWTVVELWGHDFTRTILPDGVEVPAAPQDNADYRSRAHALGYGQDSAAMSREHELGHVLLSYILGLPESPALRSAANNAGPSDLTGMEEDAVMALQRFARAAGVDLVEVALRISRADRIARL